MSVAKKTAKSAATIMVFLLISKFLGFLRELFIAARFGSGIETDAFLIAIAATTVFGTSINQVLHTTLIPIFAEIDKTQGNEGKLRYMNNMMNVIFLLTAVITILGIYAAPLIVRVLGQGFTGEQFDLTVTLSRIAFPMIIFIALGSVFTGFLQHNGKFGVPAAAGIPSNLIFILYLMLIPQFGIKGMMVASLVGWFLSMLVQIPSSHGLGYRYRWWVDFKDPHLRKVILLAGPIIIGSVAQQVNIIIDRSLASGLVEGSISALNYASKLDILILSVFVVTITTAIFPVLAQEFGKDDLESAKKVMGYGINVIIIITLPVAIGIIVLAQPIVQVLFERGAFDPRATEMTAIALAFYCVGLIGFGLREFLSKVFYSMHDTRTPMINGLIAVAINIGLNFILVKPLAHGGLALATSISGIIAVLLLLAGLRKKLGHIGGRSIATCFVKVSIASALMAIVVYFVHPAVSARLSGSFMNNAIALGLAIGAGGLVYVAMCYMLRLKELNILVEQIKGKLKGNNRIPLQ